MPGFRAGQLTYETGVLPYATSVDVGQRAGQVMYATRAGQVTYATVLVERDTASVARGSVP